MNDAELKKLINTPPVTRPIREGDIVVRVKIPAMSHMYNAPVGAVGRVTETSTDMRLNVFSFDANQGNIVYNTRVNNWQHASPAQIAEFEEREERDRS